jgi:hypothetical protein
MTEKIRVDRKLLREFFIPTWRKILLFGFFLGANIIPMVLFWTISLELMFYQQWIPCEIKALGFMFNAIILPLFSWYFLSCLLVMIYDTMKGGKK